MKISFNEINNFSNDKIIKDNNKLRKGLELHNLDSFFYLLIFGWFIAVVLYFYEYLTVCRIKRRQRNLKILFKNI
jgi:hypothetical protein